MKYSDVPNGEVFFFEGNPNYPKRKTETGHLDIRDEVSGSGAGFQNHDVRLATTCLACDGYGVQPGTYNKCHSCHGVGKV